MWLPLRPFTLYTRPGDELTEGITKFLGQKQSDNELVMATAAWQYWQLSSKYLGQSHLGSTLNLDLAIDFRSRQIVLRCGRLHLVDLHPAADLTKFNPVCS